jgi:hypothetical protein
MKVLIIEDNDYKLDDAVRTLKELGIEKYIHVNNFIEAYHLCFRKKILDTIDFIILDIQFYECRPLLGGRDLPDQHAGYKFLRQLAHSGMTTPVFVFSSVTDYLSEYRDFLLPPFTEYVKHFKSSEFLFTRASSYSEKYDEEMKSNEELLNKTNFVIGQAHNRYELQPLIKKFLDSNNQN